MFFFVNCKSFSSIILTISLLVPDYSFNLSAYLYQKSGIYYNYCYRIVNFYLSVLTVWSADDEPGEIQASIIILELEDLFKNESLKINVSLELLNGTCYAF